MTTLNNKPKFVYVGRGDAGWSYVWKNTTTGEMIYRNVDAFQAQCTGRRPPWTAR